MNIKLEIGPGKAPIGPDWDTLNFAPPATYVHDLERLPLPIAQHRYEHVYASHVLEHVPWHMTDTVLLEIRRILKPGGRFDVCVPDFAKVVAVYHDPSLIKKHHPWFRFNPEQVPMKWVSGVTFAYGPTPNWHKALFDRDYLIYCLTKAGFREVQPLAKPLTENHGWINLAATCVV